MLIPRSLRQPGLAAALVLLLAAVLLIACASPSPVPDRPSPEIQTTDPPLVIAPVTSQPDPLDGTRWLLVAFGSQQQAPAIPEEPSPLVEFETGIVSLDAGCNEVYGYYVLEKDQITVTFIEGTQVDCSDHLPGVNEVEQAFLEAMPTFGSYALEDDWLRIHYAGGELLLSHLDAMSAGTSVPITTGEVDSLAKAQEALAAYAPVTDAQPVVDLLLPCIAGWLDAGGEPSTLETILNETPMEAKRGPVTVTELDLTGDGRQDVVVRIPVMGLPLLVLVENGGSPARFAGYALPPDLEAIRTDFPLETTEIDKPAVQLEDLTGDGVPEVLFASMFAGASSYRLRPNAFQWHEGEFRLIFAADLVSWAGRSDYALEPDPTGKGSLQIVLTYPHLYNHGFDHKMINHPAGQQVWRWNPGTEKFVLSEEQVDLEQSGWESGLEPGLPLTAEDRLRWLTNEGEAAFRAGRYEEAVALYEQVLAEAGAEDWQPETDEPDWAAYAAFRRAQALLLLGQALAGLPEMEVVVTDMDGDLLGKLARAFLDGYSDGVAALTDPDAAARGVAAMQAVDLYSHFFYEGPGALRFPMDARGILYPGAGLAAYLSAHPDLASDPVALRAGLLEIGFDVEEVTPVEGGNLRIRLRPPEMPYVGAAPAPWLLTQGGGRWSVSLPISGQEWPTVGMFSP
jgi:heat shock protein HslJ